MSVLDTSNDIQFRAPHIRIKEPDACNESNNIEMSCPDAGTGVKYNYG